jgi:hypothetical protein
MVLFMMMTTLSIVAYEIRLALQSFFLPHLLAAAEVVDEVVVFFLLSRHLRQFLVSNLLQSLLQKYSHLRQYHALAHIVHVI